jgi:large subunit ribosomal protein L15
MKIHTLQADHPLKKPKRIGRGGKRGTYSGKGQKGQRSRSGAKISPLFTGGSATLTGQGSKVVHKLRGQGNSGITKNTKNYTVLNIEKIAEKFENKEVVSPETLIERGLITKRTKHIKILGRGETDKKFVFDGVVCSASVVAQFTV